MSGAIRGTNIRGCVNTIGIYVTPDSILLITFFQLIRNTSHSNALPKSNREDFFQIPSSGGSDVIVAGVVTS